MELSQVVTLQQKIKFIKQKFEEYNMKKTWIENISSLVKDDKKSNADKIKKYQNYIDLINSILNTMSKDNSALLRGIYIEKKDKKCFYMSESTFYFKHRHAVVEFIKYLSLC